MNLKFETIVKIFRKIMQLNAVIILKRTNEYHRKNISKSGRKMDLYPALQISGDVSSGFQSQSGLCNVMYVPWDPPLVLHDAILLTVSIVGWPFKMIAQHRRL